MIGSAKTGWDAFTDLEEAFALAFAKNLIARLRERDRQANARILYGDPDARPPRGILYA